MQYNFDEIYKQILAEKETCNDPCGVCYKNLNNKKVKLKCSHEFHLDCLTKKYNRIECPYCRYNQSLSGLKKICKAITSNGTICGKKSYYSCGFCSKHLDYQERKCTAIFKSGKNKGNQCGKSIYDANSDYCKRHSNYKPIIIKNKDIKKLCKYILTRGKNKGNPCCKNVFQDTDYCKYHQDNYLFCTHILTKGKNKGNACGKKTKDKSSLCKKHNIKIKEESIVI
tara:strand:- start:1029 stop:1706 length:678 start_codon:yes stop_codon:yes gene_type:complete